MRAQRGLATLEFAVGGGTALMVLFGCIEISRALYVWSTVGEATRAAAHMAAICPMNDAAIAQAAMFAKSGKSKVLHGFDASKLSIVYRDAAGAVTASLDAVQYVTVGVTGYTHTLAIPFFTVQIAVPPFATTVPAESLGYLPEIDGYACLGD